MIKFTSTYNISNRKGIGEVPKPWIVCEHEYHKDDIIDYYKKNIQYLDNDVDGDEIHDFLFTDGCAYRLTYSWYRNTSGDTDMWGEELPWILNEYYIEELDPKDANVPERTPKRSWI